MRNLPDLHELQFSHLYRFGLAFDPGNAIRSKRETRLHFQSSVVRIFREASAIHRAACLIRPSKYREIDVPNNNGPGLLWFNRLRKDIPNVRAYRRLFDGALKIPLIPLGTRPEATRDSRSGPGPDVLTIRRFTAV